MKSRRSILWRVLLNGALLSTIVWLPWWITIIFILALVARFRAYEVLLWGVVADALYAAPASVLVGLPMFFTLAFTALFIVAEYSKRFLVFY
ncbi:MAG TPA: hypothetical protein VGA06_02945 [Candidatus Paceibacterota bacterium]|jgi:hypothetical protein